MPTPPQNPPSLTAKQFRPMLAEALAADPNLARRVLMPLSGTVFPIQGGTPGTFFTVLDDGKVGIGRDSPTSVLHVQGPDASVAEAAATQVLQITGGKGGVATGTGTGGAGADAKITAGNGGDGGTGQTNGNGGSVTINPGAPGSGGGAAGNYGNVLLATSGGKVGIGTASPGAKFEILLPAGSQDGISIAVAAQSGSQARLNFGVGSNSYLQYLNNSGQLRWFNSGGERMILDSAGNLGIGTTGPTSLLHVADSRTPAAGAAATQVLQVTGGKGGAATGTGTGGAGADAKITAGDGGDGGTNQANGNGGSIFLKPGEAGSGVGSAGKRGSVLIGNGTAAKQVNGGPELVSAQGPTGGTNPENNVTLWCGLTSDENARFLFSYKGLLEWGPGGTGPSSDQDISLARNAAGNLTVQSLSPGGTDSTVTFQVKTLAGAETFGVDTTNGRVRVNGAGGAATLDVKGSNGVTGLRVEHSAASEAAFGTRIDNDNQLSFVIGADGKLSWGPGGSTTPDTILYRSAADTLRTPDSVVIDGNLTVSGTKSSVAELQDGRRVSLYALESPENWFEDFGCGQLEEGLAWVPLDNAFRETVNSEMNYHVFLTPNGDCRGLYVARKTATGFEVHELGAGRSRVSFDYRIVARRRGFEDVRLEEMLAESSVGVGKE